MHTLCYVLNRREQEYKIADDQCEIVMLDYFLHAVIMLLLGRYLSNFLDPLTRIIIQNGLLHSFMNMTRNSPSIALFLCRN